LSDPLVSVVMATYNHVEGLDYTIQSMKAQKFKDFELIIIDDASTDGTWEYLTQLDFPLLRAHRHLQNKGQTAALNFGLKLASGKYIARQDDEDISHSTRLQRQVEFLDKNDKVALVGTQLDWMVKTGELIRHFEYPTVHGNIVERLQEKNSFAHGSVMMRNEAVKKLGGYREEFRLAQDYDLWLRISENYQVANLDKTLYRMRFSTRMASVRRNGEQQAYAELAQLLARERAEQGDEVSDVKRLAAAIEKRYRKANPLTQRIRIARNYVSWAQRLLWWGEPSSKYAWSLWSQAMRAWPFSIPAWKYAARRVLKS